MSLRVAMLGLRAPWGTEGGVEHAVGQLAPRLVDLGCDVTVYCRGRYGSEIADEMGRRSGVKLVNLPTVYTKHLEAMLHSAIAAPIASRRADVVHIHATGPALWSWVPRLARRRTVVTVHGIDWQRQKWGKAAQAVLRAGAWSAAHFPHERIMVGSHLARHFSDRYQATGHVIPNGVGKIAAVPLEEGGVEGLASGRYLMFLGRLVPEKGLDRLIQAYEKSGVGLPLVIVGGSTHMDAYRAELERRAPSGVRFVGVRHGRARDALLCHARALLLPSHLEGFPLVPLEAMAAGTPVWLSDIPPHHELLSDAPSVGVCVRDGGWSEALRELAEASEKTLVEMGNQGRAFVAEHYSWERIAEATIEVYRMAQKKV